MHASEGAPFIHGGRRLNTEDLARFALSLGQGRNFWLIQPYDPVMIALYLASN
jgi:hypothetical protein